MMEIVCQISVVLLNKKKKNSNVPDTVCSVLMLSPREDEVFFDVVATVDPLTRDAQKLAPLLIVRADKLIVCWVRMQL